MNKYSISAALIAASIIAPGIAAASSVTSSATTATTATAATTASHASLRAEIIQLEKVGYNPAQVSPNYPVQLQAAEAKVTMGQPTSNRPVIVAMNERHRGDVQGVRNDDRP